jgi:hypothetical protein
MAWSTRMPRIVFAATPKKWARFFQSMRLSSMRRRKTSLTRAVGWRECPGLLRLR